MNKFIQHKMMECGMLGTSTILSASVLTRIAIHSLLDEMKTGGNPTNRDANSRLKIIRQLYDVFNCVKYPEIIEMCGELLKLRARNAVLDARADRLRREKLIGEISEPGITAAGKFSNSADVSKSSLSLYDPIIPLMFMANCRLAQWQNSSRDEIGEILQPHSPVSVGDTTNRLTVISEQFQEKVDRAVEVSTLSKAIGEAVVATVIKTTNGLPSKHPAHKLVKILKDPNHRLWTYRGIELTVGLDTVSFTKRRCTWVT